MGGFEVKKYMVLCVAGQSNAVGYDESEIPKDTDCVMVKSPCLLWVMLSRDAAVQSWGTLADLITVRW